jgi:hypothetical protein
MFIKMESFFIWEKTFLLNIFAFSGDGLAQMIRKSLHFNNSSNET